MKCWIAVAASLAVAAPGMATAATFDAGLRQSAAGTGDFNARRHHRADRAYRRPPYEPHYYARPVYYRPYPYGVPWPFVLSFGPYW
jgi:hypothetical protein